jgi:hypothetical protein
MALFKHVTHYGPQSGFPYPPSRGQPLSYTWGRATPILHLGNPFPTPGCPCLYRTIVCFSSEWYNLFEMVVHVCTRQLCVSPLNGTTSLKWLSMFVQDNCVFLLWMVQPLWNGCPCLYRTIVCFSSEWYNLFEMVVHVCTGQFKAPNSIPLGWVPLLWFVTKWVSDGCLMPNGLFFSENNLQSMRWWCCLLYTRPTNLTGSFSASPLKQQSPGKHVVPLGHVILILIQTDFAYRTCNKYQFDSLWFD